VNACAIWIPPCLEILERARRMDPADPAIVLEMGRVRGMRYDFDEAEILFEQAVAITRQK
jgi:hypothetical protein